MVKYIPPIKCQGIKTKLIEYIKNLLPDFNGIWYEPFMGSGVVGFNILPEKAIFGDTNPHLINFYNDLKNNIITPEKLNKFLQSEAVKLLEGADDYYKEVRTRFNKKPDSYDFIFLNRACFNGMMRFNSKGEFNVPFCKKPNRFAQAYITKIINQVKNVQQIIQTKQYSFINTSYENLIEAAGKNDFIYCDPPYIDRHSSYYNDWNAENENCLYQLLKTTQAQFILSTWVRNSFRENTYIEKIWKEFNIEEIEHFYFVGAQEKNRNAITEALIYNFRKTVKNYNKTTCDKDKQLVLF